MQNDQRFIELLDQYLSGAANPEDFTLLMQLIKSGEHDDALKQKIDDIMNNPGENLNIGTDRAHDLMYKILSAEKQTAKLLPLRRPVRKLWQLSAAAIIIAMLCTGGYFYFNQPVSAEHEMVKTNVPDDVRPGGNKAILTLSDGSQIILDSAANGALTQQGNTKVIKHGNGQVAYHTSAKGSAVITYNTISTPKGGLYQIILADGSKVWLNSASSLTFPTSFSGKERNVELTGEGYFEVAKNAAMPFHVKVSGMQVEVLGTHFNINAYADEATIKTTLLEGAVKVSKELTTALLKPGQQSTVNKRGEIKVEATDVEEAVAWKNGKFHFGNAADIAVVMRQIARWYDVDVEYKGTITGHIGGTISTNVNASQVFKMLEMTGSMKFRIEGRKVIVMQ